MEKLNKKQYLALLDQDLAWLAKMPDTLERRHIESIVNASVPLFYPHDRVPDTGSSYKEDDEYGEEDTYEECRTCGWSEYDEIFNKGPKHDNYCPDNDSLYAEHVQIGFS